LLVWGKKDQSVVRQPYPSFPA